VLSGVDERLNGFDGRVNDFPQFDSFLTKIDFAACNSRDIEQVINEPRQMHRLPFHDVDRLAPVE
jgi:hypothetical protein